MSPKAPSLFSTNAPSRPPLPGISITQVPLNELPDIQVPLVSPAFSSIEETIPTDGFTNPDATPGETLRRVQDVLDTSQQLALLGSWEWNVATGSLSWSAQNFRNFGLEPHSITPTFDGYVSRVHPDDRELVTTTVQAAVVSGEPFEYFHRVVWPDNSIHTLHARGHLVKDPVSGALRMIGTGQDVSATVELQAERTALAAAAVANRRIGFLSDATLGLYTSLDYESRLADLAQFVVPTLGDWCAVDILQPDQSLKRLAVVHSNPEKIRLAQQLIEEYPEDPDVPTSRESVLRTRTPAFVGEITREMIDLGARDKRHADLIHELGIRAFITIPLIARDQPLGTLTVVMAESGRSYDSRDVTFLMDLGNRAAIAIDNARLHKESQAKTIALEEQTSRLEDLLEEQRATNEILSEQAIEMEIAQQSLVESSQEMEAQSEELQTTVEELSESESRYRFLADSIPVQVWTARPDGNLDYVSKRTATFFARTQEEIIGNGWIDVVHPDDRDAAIEAWTSALQSGKSYEIEFRLWSAAASEYVWHLGRAVPLHDEDGQVTKWFGSNTNIDVQKRISEERERLKHEAQAANQAKMEFLAAMSHELRTPLNAINGYTDLMLMDIAGILTDTQRDYVARIHRSGKFLLGLINDVLNFAKIDAGVVEVRRDPVDLGLLLGGIHTLIEPQFRAKKQHYNYEGSNGGCKAIGDFEKIEQVVLNLLTNASKFTSEGGRISLECSSQNGIAQILVIDNGRGISVDDVETIFDPFVQVDRGAHSSSQQGVGLGLAISRELAIAMGGDLRVQSVIGEGSVFTFTLPAE